MTPQQSSAPLETKHIQTGAQTYVAVRVAHRPGAISPADWDRLSQLNDYIIDHVSYDQARSDSALSQGVQTPDVTLERGLGICMDYAALFECRARQLGYQVRSMRSATMRHAWNTVLLAGHWWIIDVTWNDGEILAGGEPVPRVVREDPDFRKRYFLVTPDLEAAQQRQGLIRTTHAASDAVPVDYQRTLEARGIIRQIDPLVTRRNKIVRTQRQIIEQLNALVAEYNHIVALSNAQHAASAQAPFRAQLVALRADLADSRERVRRVKTAITTLDTRISELYTEFRRLEAAYPLAISYTLGTPTPQPHPGDHP